eukprot:gene17866-20348_t
MSHRQFIPDEPVKENDYATTTLPWDVLKGVPSDVFEKMMEEISGKVQVSRSRKQIERDIPHCRRQAALTTYIHCNFYSYNQFWGYASTSGTDITAYKGGEMLSSDFHVFTPEQMYDHEVAVNLSKVGPAPFMVAEIVWDSDANKEGRGFRKVKDDLFPAVGKGDTQIQEIWVLVISKKKYDHRWLRTPCKFSNLWFVGSLIQFVLEVVLGMLLYTHSFAQSTDFNGWRGWLCNLCAELARVLIWLMNDTPQATAAPPVGDVPYLAICLRDQPIRYFALQRDQVLLLPRQCLHCGAWPIHTNKLYSRLK